MSTAQTPIAATFELQRQSIEFGERLFEQALTAQRDAMETTTRYWSPPNSRSFCIFEAWGPLWP